MSPEIEMPAMGKENESRGGIDTIDWELRTIKNHLDFTKSAKLNLTVADISTRQEKLPGRRDSEPIP